MSHFPPCTPLYVTWISFILHVRANDRTHFHFIRTSVTLQTCENCEDYKKRFLRYYTWSNRIDFFQSTQYPYRKKKEPHINLRTVDWTIPPSIASPGICKIIGHYPDPKSRGAGDRLSSTQFECSSVVVICPRYSNRSWGATAVRRPLLAPRRGANGAENADK